MTSWFFYIPTNEINPAMIVLSTSQSVEQFPVSYFNNYPFYLVEVTYDQLIAAPTVFSGYKKYSVNEVATAIPSAPGQLVDLRGIFNESVPVNGDTQYTWTIPDNRIVKAVYFGVKDSTHGDYITVDVVLPPLDVTVGVFVTRFYLQDGIFREQIIPSVMQQGLKIRLTYHSSAPILGTKPKFFMNLVTDRLG